MDNKEKQILVTVISLFLIFTFYSFYIYYEYIADNFEIINDFKFWGKVFLVIIPVTIVSQILIHIIFAIINKAVTKEDIETKTDERDKIINLKAIRISHFIITFGFVVSMVTQAIGMQQHVMFLTWVCFGFIAAIVSELAKIHYYRKGF